MKHKVECYKVEEMGMITYRWYLDEVVCVEVGVGEDWATIYSVSSSDRGKGYTQKLLGFVKDHYEEQGKTFAGTVALNNTMRHIYKKLGIHEHK